MKVGYEKKNSGPGVNCLSVVVFFFVAPFLYVYVVTFYHSYLIIIIILIIIVIIVMHITSTFVCDMICLSTERILEILTFRKRMIPRWWQPPLFSLIATQKPVLE
jgi:hypothetical protein